MADDGTNHIADNYINDLVSKEKGRNRSLQQIPATAMMSDIKKLLTFAEEKARALGFDVILLVVQSGENPEKRVVLNVTS